MFIGILLHQLINVQIKISAVTDKMGFGPSTDSK